MSDKILDALANTATRYDLTDRKVEPNLALSLIQDELTYLNRLRTHIEDKVIQEPSIETSTETSTCMKVELLAGAIKRERHRHDGQFDQVRRITEQALNTDAGNCGSLSAFACAQQLARTITEQKHQIDELVKEVNDKSETIRVLRDQTARDFFESKPQPGDPLPDLKEAVLETIQKNVDQVNRILRQESE